MQNTTPNLGLQLDVYGKVGLDQAITDAFARIGARLNIDIPVRTEGMFALKQSYEEGLKKIAAALGVPLTADTNGVIGMSLSLIRNLVTIDVAIGGSAPTISNTADDVNLIVANVAGAAAAFAEVESSHTQLRSDIDALRPRVTLLENV